MNTSATIKNETLPPSQDYLFLREQGLRHLERLAGHIWTDFNTHDPGITLLEQLCYAITDLGYRIEYDLKDLLASPDNEENPYEDLYSPAQILSSLPVTLKDYRKLLLDMDGVRNAWIEVVDLAKPMLRYHKDDKKLVFDDSTYNEDLDGLKLRGLYKVVIEPEETEDGAVPLDEADLIQKIKEKWMANRNVGENLDSVFLLKKEEISVKAIIEISDSAEVENLLATIYYELERFISPDLRFYSLTELLSRGWRMDEIMDGPVLQNGFIDQEEMEQFDKKAYLRSSDLIRMVMNLPGVRLVKSIELIATTNSGVSRSADWSLDLLSDYYPRLNKDFLDSSVVNLSIQLEKGDLTIQPNREDLQFAYEALCAQNLPTSIDINELDTMPSKGKFRNLENYFSIQNQFPEVYGIGKRGLPKKASYKRHGEAKQLKAYLLFFDQLLANYFAQLAHGKDLFRFSQTPEHVYFSQYPGRSDYSGSVPVMEALLIKEEAEHIAQLAEITEENEKLVDRRHRLYNHLLGRFCENFSDYCLLMYGINETNPAYDSNELETKLLRDKQTFLKEYTAFGSQRNKAFNFQAASWGTDNISGLERRIGRLLGIEHMDKRNLTSSLEEEGFHMVEHLLLRPLGEDLPPEPDPSISGEFGEDRSSLDILNGVERKDPFSLQLSFIFPDFFGRFQIAEFRNFVERIVRQETPVHLLTEVRWLSETELAVFEEAYEEWLQCLETEQETMYSLRAARDRLIDVLSLKFETDPEDWKPAFGHTFSIRDLPVAADRDRVVVGETVRIVISNSQKDVEYQLLNVTSDEISDGVVGNSGQLTLESKPLMEHPAVFHILATKLSDPQNSFWLRGEVEVEVALLNDTLPVKTAPGKQFIEYEGESAVIIEQAEVKVTYSLHFAYLRDRDFIFTDEDEDGVLDIEINEAQIVKEEDVLEYLVLENQVTGEVAVSGTDLEIPIPPEVVLQEDIVVKIIATSQLTGAQETLQQRAFIYVEPNPGVAYEVIPPSDGGDDFTTILIESPQPGVYYHLMKDGVVLTSRAALEADKGIADAAAENPLPFRIGVDLIVNATSEATIIITTSEAGEVGDFEVKAEMFNTGMTVLLSNT